MKEPLPLFSTLSKARYSVLHLHPSTSSYYVVDEWIVEHVRLFGAPNAVPYTYEQAHLEAVRRNTEAGFVIGTYEVVVRQAADPLFRDKLALPWEIEEILVKNADLFYSHSGGKDSDAMALVLERLRYKRRRHGKRKWGGKRTLLHADTGRTEWSVTEAYVRRRAEELALPLRTIRRPQGDLLDEMWARHRKRPDVPPFPSSQWRWCTSDQKSSQLHKLIRELAPSGTAVCAIGIRALESPKRAKEPIWSIRGPTCCSTRMVYDWHPLFFFTEEAVWRALGVSLAHLNDLRASVRYARENKQDEFAVIAAAGWQFHVAYPLGAKRMSCSCCFLARKEDVKIGAHYHPETYREIVELEIASGFSYFQDGTWLGSLCPHLLTQDQRQRLACVMDEKARRDLYAPKRSTKKKKRGEEPPFSIS